MSSFGITLGTSSGNYSGVVTHIDVVGESTRDDTEYELVGPAYLATQIPYFPYSPDYEVKSID